MSTSEKVNYRKQYECFIEGLMKGFHKFVPESKFKLPDEAKSFNTLPIEVQDAMKIIYNYISSWRLI